MSIQQKIYIKIVVTILLIVFVSMFLFPSLLQSIEEEGHNFNVKKSNLESFLTKETYLETLTNDYSLVEKDIQALRNSFLTSERAIDFIEEIEKIAGETGNVEEIRILKSVDADDQIESIKFQVSLHGGFQNLMKFLVGIENGKYMARVIGFSINKLPASSLVGLSKDIPGLETGSVKSVLDIEVYTL